MHTYNLFEISTDVKIDWMLILSEKMKMVSLSQSLKIYKKIK